MIVLYVFFWLYKLLGFSVQPLCYGGQTLRDTCFVHAMPLATNVLLCLDCAQLHYCCALVEIQNISDQLTFGVLTFGWTLGEAAFGLPRAYSRTSGSFVTARTLQLEIISELLSVQSFRSDMLTIVMFFIASAQTLDLFMMSIHHAMVYLRVD